MNYYQKNFIRQYSCWGLLFWYSFPLSSRSFMPWSTFSHSLEDGNKEKWWKFDLFSELFAFTLYSPFRLSTTRDGFQRETQKVVTQWAPQAPGWIGSQLALYQFSVHLCLKYQCGERMIRVWKHHLRVRPSLAQFSPTRWSFVRDLKSKSAPMTTLASWMM